MALTNFYRAEVKKFYGIITLNGVNPDITSDVVNFIMKLKKGDSDAIINKNADVSAGSGRYDIALTKVETAIASKTYCYEIIWKLASGEEYVLDQDKVMIKSRV